jgi:hypothetical protein
MIVMGCFGEKETWEFLRSSGLETLQFIVLLESFNVLYPFQP